MTEPIDPRYASAPTYEIHITVTNGERSTTVYAKDNPEKTTTRYHKSLGTKVREHLKGKFVQVPKITSSSPYATYLKFSAGTPLEYREYEKATKHEAKSIQQEAKERNERVPGWKEAEAMVELGRSANHLVGMLNLYPWAQ
jgi:hypothetical protein